MLDLTKKLRVICSALERQETNYRLSSIYFVGKE